MDSYSHSSYCIRAGEVVCPPPVSLSNTFTSRTYPPLSCLACSAKARDRGEHGFEASFGRRPYFVKADDFSESLRAAPYFVRRERLSEKNTNPTGPFPPPPLVFTLQSFALQGRSNLLSSALLCIAEARVGLKTKWGRTDPCVEKLNLIFNLRLLKLINMRMKYVYNK